MAIRAEFLRIESKELMEVLQDAAKKFYNKQHGRFNYELNTEQIWDIIYTNPQKIYTLRIIFDGTRYEPGGSRFEFSGVSIEELYTAAIATVKAWSAAYFQETEIEIPEERIAKL